MAQLGLEPGTPCALAVSGGGDSVALMHLFAEWAGPRRGMHAVLTVDHGLREGSRAEAHKVRDWAAKAGFPAAVLFADGVRPRSNVEEQARTLRYRLLGEWCHANGVAALVLAHTLDDQAETFLLRLARGSGVDGLSAMKPKAPLPLAALSGVTLFRPLLAIGRAELRRELKRRGVDYLEDPMNEDPRFARVRFRAVLPHLEAAGLSAGRIASAAAHLARARDALERETKDFLGSHARMAGEGAALLDAKALREVHREIGLRALSTLLMQVSGAHHRPRFERLERLYDALLENGAAPRTLLGCRVGRAPKAKAAFGPSTVQIVPEAAQRRPPKASERRFDRHEGTGSARKLPQKGRNPGLSSNS